MGWEKVVLLGSLLSAPLAAQSRTQLQVASGYETRSLMQRADVTSLLGPDAKPQELSIYASGWFGEANVRGRVADVSYTLGIGASRLSANIPRSTERIERTIPHFTVQLGTALGDGFRLAASNHTDIACRGPDVSINKKGKGDVGCQAYVETTNDLGLRYGIRLAEARIDLQLAASHENVARRSSRWGGSVDLRYSVPVQRDSTSPRSVGGFELGTRLQYLTEGDYRALRPTLRFAMRILPVAHGPQPWVFTEYDHIMVLGKNLYRGINTAEPTTPSIEMIRIGFQLRQDL